MKILWFDSTLFDRRCLTFSLYLHSSRYSSSIHSALLVVGGFGSSWFSQAMVERHGKLLGNHKSARQDCLLTFVEWNWMASFIMPQSEPIRQLFAQLMNGCQCSLSAAIYEEEETHFKIWILNDIKARRKNFPIWHRKRNASHRSATSSFHSNDIPSEICIIKGTSSRARRGKGKKCEGKSSSSEYLMKKERNDLKTDMTGEKPRKLHRNDSILIWRSMCTNAIFVNS